MEYRSFPNLQREPFCSELRILASVPIGNKHRGRLVGEVAVEDPGYLIWMFDKDFDPEVNAGISQALGR